MPWHAELEPQRRIVVVSYDGHVTSDDIRACVERVIRLLLAERTNKVLVELGGVTRIDTTTTDMVALPDLFRALGQPEPFRQAIVVPPGRLPGLLEGRTTRPEKDASMQIPLQISLHGISPSDALQDAIREKATRLERFADRITSCRVVLEVDGRHSRQGRQLRARIDLTTPGKEIVANRAHHEDVRVALRDAFADVLRQLDEHVRTRRGEVKQHAG